MESRKQWVWLYCQQEFESVPHILWIEREKDKQVERLPVGTNRSGISIETQRQNQQEEGERSCETIQRKSKEMQAGDSPFEGLSTANKLSCSRAPRHSNNSLFVFEIWQLRARLRARSRQLPCQAVVYFPSELSNNMGQTGKGPMSEDTEKHRLLERPAISDKGTAFTLTIHAHSGIQLFIPLMLDMEVKGRGSNRSWGGASHLRQLTAYVSVDLPFHNGLFHTMSSVMYAHTMALDWNIIECKRKGQQNINCFENISGEKCVLIVMSSLLVFYLFNSTSNIT